MDTGAEQPFADAMPGRHSGDLCFAGTRVPVSTLFECLAGGDSLGAFLAAFPSVSTGQARLALRKATVAMALGKQAIAAAAKPPLVFAMPGPHDGELCFAGTRVPVRDLFAHLRQGCSLDDFFKRRPEVTQEQAEFALRKANAVIEQDYGLPAPVAANATGDRA